MMQALDWWLARRCDPTTFPYHAVLHAYHRVGKHFVDKELLADLDHVRRWLPVPVAPTVGHRRLARFLDVCLDKWDGRYDYRSYLALSLLPLPDPDHATSRAAAGAADRLRVQLIFDAVRFDRVAVAGATGRLPLLRPSAGLVAKRHRLALRAVGPALHRLGVASAAAPADTAVWVSNLLADRLPGRAGGEDRAAVQMSMLPVFVIHDEYLFIRVLQAFETTFAAVAVRLRAAVCALQRADAVATAREVDAATAAMRESAPLFSLLATMNVQAFRRFRVYTDGASAIQSGNYKRVESLCRTPDPDRLHSAAYRSVPDVRDRVVAGQPTLDGTFRHVAPDLTANARAELQRSLERLAAAMGRWRHTHYRLAVRMLGAAQGSGGTDGTTYLAQARSVPLFCPATVDPHPPGTDSTRQQRKSPSHG